MNRWLTKLLYPERGPLRRFWIWLHRQLDPVIARAHLTQVRRSPAVMGIPILVMAGDDTQIRGRIAEVLAYVARSPRHFSRLRRTLTHIGVGAPTIRHGRYVPQIGACNLALRELQIHSIPALAATLVHAVTEARVHRAVFDRRRATPEEWRRLPILCVRASTDFLDYTQHTSRSGLTSA